MAGRLRDIPRWLVFASASAAVHLLGFLVAGWLRSDQPMPPPSRLTLLSADPDEALARELAEQLYESAPPPEPEPEPEPEPPIRPGIAESDARTRNWLGEAEADREHTARLVSDHEQAQLTRQPASPPPAPPTERSGPETPPSPASQDSPPSPVTEPTPPREQAESPAAEPDDPAAEPAVETRPRIAAAAAPPPQPSGALAESSTTGDEAIRLETPNDLTEPVEEAPEEPADGQTGPAAEQPDTPTEDQEPQEPTTAQQVAEALATPALPSPQPAQAFSAPRPPQEQAPQPREPHPTDPGIVGDAEAVATALREAAVVDFTKPLAREGLEVQTVRPRWHRVTRLTARPRDPVIVVRFNHKGEVLRASFLYDEEADQRFSTGDQRVDDPLLQAVYRWRAAGKPLEELAEDETFDWTFRIRLR